MLVKPSQIWSNLVKLGQTCYKLVLFGAGHYIHRNPNVYRSMRDHIHPPRVSAPSCIVPPPENIIIKPYIVPLLPTFHGMVSENPYSHIREFEEVCNTFKEDISNVDLMRLKFFHLTLKDNVTPRPERVYGMCNRMCTKGFLNYFSTIIEFLKVVLRVKL